MLTEICRQVTSILYSEDVGALDCEENGEGGTLPLKWPSPFWPADHAYKAPHSVQRVEDQSTTALSTKIRHGAAAGHADLL